MPVCRAKKSFAERRTSAGLWEVVVSWSVRLCGDIMPGRGFRVGACNLDRSGRSYKLRTAAVGILQLGFAKPSRTGQTKMSTSRSVLRALALASAIVVSGQASGQGAAPRQATAKPTQLPPATYKPEFGTM